MAGFDDQTNATDRPLPVSPVFHGAGRFSAITGVSGLLYGGVDGLFRSPRPLIRCIATGIQWSVFGASFWVARNVMLSYSVASSNGKSYTSSNPTPSQRNTSSALAGGLSGGMVSYTLGRNLPIRSFIVIGTLSYLGQRTYDALDNWQLQKQQQQQQQFLDPNSTSSEENSRRKPVMQRLLNSKWLLMKHLSDQEYLDILNEKKLGIEVEIALLDEKIAEIEKTRQPKNNETSL